MYFIVRYIHVLFLIAYLDESILSAVQTSQTVNRPLSNYVCCIFSHEALISGYSPGGGQGTPISHTPYPTGDKHTISTFVDQTHIQRIRPRRKTVFFKTSLRVFTPIYSLGGGVPLGSRKSYPLLDQILQIL